jgi:hypothetical protein
MIKSTLRARPAGTCHLQAVPAFSEVNDQLIAKLHQLAGRVHQDCCVIGITEALYGVMQGSQHLLDPLDQGERCRGTHQPRHRALPACLPDQLIDAIGQRVEIKVTSARQPFCALPKRARDIGNGLQKVGERPQRASLPLARLATAPLLMLQPGATGERQRHASQRRTSRHELGHKVGHDVRVCQRSPVNARRTSALDRGRLFAIPCPFYCNAPWRTIRGGDPDGRADMGSFEAAIRHGHLRAAVSGQELRGTYHVHHSRQSFTRADLATMCAPGNGHQSGQALDAAAETLHTLPTAHPHRQPARRRLTGGPMRPRSAARSTPRQAGARLRPRLGGTSGPGWRRCSRNGGRGVPDWVTAVEGVSRTAQLRLVGNGVVPQQGAAALQILIAIAARYPAADCPGLPGGVPGRRAAA